MKKGLILFSIILIGIELLASVQFANASNSKNDRNEIIVKYKNVTELTTNKAVNTIKQRLKPQKMERKKLINQDSSRLEVITIGKNDDAKSIAQELSKESNIEFAVPNNKIKLFSVKNGVTGDPLFKLQWGLSNTGQVIAEQKGKRGVDIDISGAWRITKGSPAVVVGVLDTGIDYKHKDLKKNIYVNKREKANNKKDDDNNGYVDDFNGWDFGNDDKSVFDDPYVDEHGTLVAGIIAAESSNRVGISGVAPKVKILPLKFINFDGGYVSDAIEGIEYAKEKGVTIINCSWGLYKDNEALKDAIKTANILFVCSAGNDMSDVSELPTYPACYNLPNIISVAAVNNQGNLCFFSNYGKGVDVAAPGESIISTFPNNKYEYDDGTSMAVPFVTGVAALLKSIRPNLTPYQIKQIIKENVKKSDSLQKYVDSSGVIDANLALGVGTTF